MRRTCAHIQTLSHAQTQRAFHIIQEDSQKQAHQSSVSADDKGQRICDL